MARVDLVPTIPTTIANNGTALTNVSGTTIVPGADNGFQIKPIAGDILILNEVTAGVAVITLVSPADTKLESLGAVITDATMSIASNFQHVISIPSVLLQADGKLYLDCDVAIEVTLLRMAQQA